jgi:hypothetical protein
MTSRARLTPLALILLLASFFAPLPVIAQTEIGVSAGFGALTGDDFEGAEAGPTFGAAVRFGVAPSAQLGIAVDYSSYGLDEADENLDQIDALAVGRFLFPSGGGSFFAGGKAGYSRQSTDVGAASASANGFVVGPTVGAQIPAGAVAVDIEVDALFHSYGALSTDGLSDPATEASGFRVVGRAGISFLLGG